VLAAPLTLALQSGGPATRAWLRRALRSRPVHLLTRPIVAWCLFGGGLVALYLTPLLSLSVRNGLVHLLVHAHVVIAGSLFLAVLVGVDPLPGRPPFAARLLALLVAVPFHAVVGLALLSAGSPVAPDVYPSLSDQRTAAGLFWGTGELFTLVVAAVVVRQWWVAEQRAAARELART
jgi:putative copper resistance protein D